MGTMSNETTKFIKLNNVDPDDISIILAKIQRSFNIKLDNEGLKDVDYLR